jgi:hypothetical protein
MSARQEILNWAVSRKRVKRLDEPKTVLPLSTFTGWKELIYSAGYIPDTTAARAGNSSRIAHKINHLYSLIVVQDQKGYLKQALANEALAIANREARKHKIRFSVKNCLNQLYVVIHLLLF